MRRMTMKIVFYTKMKWNVGTLCPKNKIGTLFALIKRETK